MMLLPAGYCKRVFTVNWLLVYTGYRLWRELVLIDCMMYLNTCHMYVHMMS